MKKAKKQKPKYNIEDYRFTETRVYYRDKYLNKFELAKHLTYWWPGVGWVEWAKVGYYKELKQCIESKIHIRKN